MSVVDPDALIAAAEEMRACTVERWPGEPRLVTVTSSSYDSIMDFLQKELSMTPAEADILVEDKP